LPVIPATGPPVDALGGRDSSSFFRAVFLRMFTVTLERPVSSVSQGRDILDPRHSGLQALEDLAAVGAMFERLLEAGGHSRRLAPVPVHIRLEEEGGGA